MKIAFVSQLDPGNIQEWSGSPYFMVQALRDRGHLVKEVGPLKSPISSMSRVFQRAYQALTSTCYDVSRHPLEAKLLANQAKRIMGSEHFDVVLCPSSIVCAGLEITAPIVTWEDATFAGMVGYYPGKWQNFCKATLKHANFLQQQSLRRAAFSVFSSEWAAQSALSNYTIENEKIRVIPLGANLATIPTHLEVAESIDKRCLSPECRLLFIGVDWHRKGGDLVVLTASALRDKGFNVTVDVVGCEPPSGLPSFVQSHGFISKTSPDGEKKLRSLFLAAHYLFVPSLAECFGLVFAEASAFGVPSLAKATGGIPSAVRNGLNGWAFGIDEPVGSYVDYIARQLDDIYTYRTSALRARKLFDEELNWRSAIERLEVLIQPLQVRQ